MIPVLNGIDQWDQLLAGLPFGWETKARDLKAFVRPRKFKNAGDLLRVILMHVDAEFSLRLAAAWATEAELADITDMAVYKGMRRSVEWLEWIDNRILKRLRTHARIKRVGTPIHIADGTTVRQPGSVGIDQRVHFMWDASAQGPADYLAGSYKKGESFRNFAITPGTLYMGDRLYGNRAGIEHVANNGGYALVRINAHNLPLNTRDGGKFDLLGALRTLPEGGIGEWPVVLKGEDGPITGRVCGVRVDPETRMREEERARACSRKKRHAIKPQTVEMAGFVAVFTTLSPQQADTRTALDLLRARWQVEISIKCHKQILNLGENPHKNPEAARAWLLGKLLCFLLFEILRQQAEDFSPSERCGAPVRERALPVARAKNMGLPSLAVHCSSVGLEGGTRELV
jgi:hypothetical protein